jgi:hypothetical protein
MKALDECAKVHPFIAGELLVGYVSLFYPNDSAVAVLAFRAAYELERKRRDNDRRIKALFVEMGDMMAALTQ